MEPTVNSDSTKIQAVTTQALINVSEVRLFDKIQDYIVPSKMVFAYVVKTPEGLFCLDGYEKIIEAQKNGCENTEVLLEQRSEHVDTDIAAIKFKLRNETKKKYLYYPETLRHVCVFRRSRPPNPTQVGHLFR